MKLPLLQLSKSTAAFTLSNQILPELAPVDKHARRINCIPYNPTGPLILPPINSVNMDKLSRALSGGCHIGDQRGGQFAQNGFSIAALTASGGAESVADINVLFVVAQSLLATI